VKYQIIVVATEETTYTIKAPVYTLYSCTLDMKREYKTSNRSCDDKRRARMTYRARLRGRLRAQNPTNGHKDIKTTSSQSS
jgi:hypothetical protein